MSWMDSWSRPRKDQSVPAPFYLTQPDAKYCHTCGRVIGTRRSKVAKTSQADVKYCSDKCKRHKPSTAPASVERRIEAVLKDLLEGHAVEVPQSFNEESRTVQAKHQAKKGDPRVVVLLSEVEEAVFGNRHDPEKVFGRRKNRAQRGVPNEAEALDDVLSPQSGPPFSMDDSKDYTESDDDSADGGHAETGGVRLLTRPPQSRSEVNFSVGGERGWAEKIEETPEMEKKRLEGVMRASEKELIRQAARRAVVFGLTFTTVAAGESGKSRRSKKKTSDDLPGVGAEESSTRKCEAIMGGSIVEPSFAKGDWSIRWRED